MCAGSVNELYHRHGTYHQAQSIDFSHQSLIASSIMTMDITSLDRVWIEKKRVLSDSPAVWSLIPTADTTAIPTLTTKHFCLRSVPGKYNGPSTIGRVLTNETWLCRSGMLYQAQASLAVCRGIIVAEFVLKTRSANGL